MEKKMRYLKQILVIVFMLALTFVPEAQLYPSRWTDGQETIIRFSAFTDISMVPFWQIWVMKITGIIYFAILCLLLIEYIVCAIKKEKAVEKLIQVTRLVLVFFIIFRLAFVLFQQSDFYGINEDKVFYDYFLTVYFLQLFLAVAVIKGINKKQKTELEKNKYTYIFYIFLLWISCLLPYSNSVTHDIEGYLGGINYTIFWSENIYGEVILEFLISGFCMEKLWVMWLVLAVLIGVMNVKYFKKKIYILVHRLLNIVTIVFLIYTSGFCVFYQWFNPEENFLLNPITAVCFGIGVKLLFIETDNYDNI